MNMDAETDGRRSIAGFLLQILRSIKLGLDMSLTFTQLGDGSQLVLHLEPAEGGDAKVVGGRLVTILDEWCPPTPGLALYYPRSRHVPSPLRAFIDLLKRWDGTR